MSEKDPLYTALSAVPDLVVKDEPEVCGGQLALYGHIRGRVVEGGVEVAEHGEIQLALLLEERVGLEDFIPTPYPRYHVHLPTYVSSACKTESY